MATKAKTGAKALQDKYPAGEYVLLSQKWNDLDGDEHTRGDVLEFEDPKEIRRLFESGAISKPDTRAARTARIDSTEDPQEQAELEAENIEEQAKAMLARAKQLRGEAEQAEEAKSTEEDAEPPTTAASKSPRTGK